MCLAVPGKIIEINGDFAIVDYGETKIKARIVLGNYKKGDYVLIQGKIVVEKVPKKQVEAWKEMVKNAA